MFVRKDVMKRAFTLAEVLITLGIIGVVAALTIPALIQNYKNHETEARLAKFYSVVNQAIAMAEVDYGDKIYWAEDGNDPKKRDAWFKKYFFPYMKIVKSEPLGNGTTGLMIYYLEDGSAFASVNGGNINRDWLYYPYGQEKCRKGDSSTGVCRFWFFFCPNCNDLSYKSKGLEPWRSGTNSAEYLESCKNSQFRYGCTALIYVNGWKIPKNYPYKVK